MSSRRKPRCSYYAVTEGRTLGVFLQWSLAQASTDKFPGSSLKGFVTFKSAVSYLIESGFESEDIMVTVDGHTVLPLKQFKEQHASVLDHSDNDNDNQDDNDNDNQDAGRPTCNNVDLADSSEQASAADIDQPPGDDHAPNNEQAISQGSHDGDLITFSQDDKTVPLQAPGVASVVDNIHDTVVPSQIVKSTSLDIPCTDASKADNDKGNTDASKADNDKGKRHATDFTPEAIHPSCLNMIRDLQNSLVDKLYGVMQENYSLKHQLLQKELDICRKDNDSLSKQNNKLTAENTRLHAELNSKTGKCHDTCASADAKVHKLRVDLEQTAKSRHQQYLADKAELQVELTSLKAALKQHQTVVLEKEKQISLMQERLLAADEAVRKAQDAAYEAKRTQIVTSDSDFTTVKGKKPRSQPVSSVQTVPVQAVTSHVADPVSAESPRSNNSSPSVQSYAIAAAQPPPSRSSVPPRQFQDSQPPLTPTAHNTSKPHVVIIGNSHLSAIDANRLVPQAKVTLIKAFTIDEAAECLENLTFEPHCVVIHEITNDISQGYSPDVCSSYLNSVVDYYAHQFPRTKFIISLGLPRLDNSHYNVMTEITNAMLKGGMSHSNVSFCDNSNFTKNGIPQHHLLSRNDGYHLSPEGTKMFSSNLRCKIEKVLNLRSKFRKGI